MLLSLKLRHLPLLAPLVLVACGGSSSSPTGTNGGNLNPPPATKARITIQTNTTKSTIWAGSIYGRFGSQSSTRVQFGPQDGYCLAAPARTCYFDVTIGDSVSLAATDVAAGAKIGVYTSLSQVDDPRTIQSQFVAWSGPCVTRERGVCVLKATGDVTISAQYKPLTLTKFLFSGLNSWLLEVVAPATLGLTSIDPPMEQKLATGYGSVFVVGGPQAARCIGVSPGERCVFILTTDNSTIHMEVFPPENPQPLGSPGPLNFVGWGGACLGAPATHFGISACNLASGIDQTAVVKWEYYQCLLANGTPYATEGTSGWKLPASATNGCTLTQ